MRLREKGGKRHEMPCHHTLEEYLHAYLNGTGISDDVKGPVVPNDRPRHAASLPEPPCPRPTLTPWCGGAPSPPQSARRSATTASGRLGITAYLKNGGTLENAAAMANHASTRTTQLYDRRRDDISLDEVERIRV